MAKKRFTFADAKEKIKHLEDQLEKAIQIVDASDRHFTESDTRKVKYLEAWAIVAPIIFTIIGGILF